MDKQTKISFGAIDNGVSSFMKKVQQESKVMHSQFTEEAIKQTATLNRLEMIHCSPCSDSVLCAKVFRLVRYCSAR